jgi:Sulfotransferase family
MSTAQHLLDAAVCLTRAQKATGLSDFGDDSLPERFEVLVKHIQAAGLDSAGRQAAIDTIHWHLTSRLSFFDDHKRHRMGEEKIVRPIIATGEPRSGTTLLHALLAQDPNGRSLKFWEVMYPSPPPGAAHANDPRVARANADWREMLERIPRWIVSHPYNDMLGEGLPECERTWAFDFRATYPTAWWRVPMMPVPGLPEDTRAQYRIHKMMLQHVQHGRPPKYWVLKGTSHHHRLAALFEAYPDARVIWTHRDPVQSIASRIVLVGQIAESIDPRIDWTSFAKGIVTICRANFRSMSEDPLADDPRVFHVLYQDMVRDPIGKLRAAYEKFGVSFTPEAKERATHWLANNRSDRYGKFEYSTDVIKEDIEQLYREFEPYSQRFRVPRDLRK